MSIDVGAKRAVFGLCLCILFAANSSCVIIPVPAAPWKDVIIEEETLASIEVGKDNRDSLIRLLGTPLLRSPDNSRWAYITRIYETSNVYLCVGVGAGYGDFDCDRLGEKQTEFLDVRFEPDGTLRRLETKTPDASGCTDSGICLGVWPRKFALYAESLSDRRSDQTAQGSCTVSAYLSSDNPEPEPLSHMPFDFSWPLPLSYALQLSPDQAVLWVQKDDFVRAIVTPGIRRIWAISQYDLTGVEDLQDHLEWVHEKRELSDEEMASAPWVSIDVDCGPGEVRYFELKHAQNGAEQILEVESVRGKQEIAKRRQLISMYASELPFVQPVTPGMKP